MITAMLSDPFCATPGQRAALAAHCPAAQCPMLNAQRANAQMRKCSNAKMPNHLHGALEGDRPRLRPRHREAAAQVALRADGLRRTPATHTAARRRILLPDSRVLSPFCSPRCARPADRDDEGEDEADVVEAEHGDGHRDLELGDQRRLLGDLRDERRHNLCGRPRAQGGGCVALECDVLGVGAGEGRGSVGGGAPPAPGRAP
jgi:hypothetical protein